MRELCMLYGAPLLLRVTCVKYGTTLSLNGLGLSFSQTVFPTRETFSSDELSLGLSLRTSTPFLPL